MSGIFVRKRSSLLTPHGSRPAVVQRKHSCLPTGLGGSRNSSTSSQKFQCNLQVRGTNRSQGPSTSSYSRHQSVSPAKYQSSGNKTQFKDKSGAQQDAPNEPFTVKKTNFSRAPSSTGPISELLKISFDLQVIDDIITELKHDKLASATDEFFRSSRRVPALGRIDENPPIPDGPDNSRPKHLSNVNNLEINITAILNEIKEVKSVCADNKKLNESVYTIHHDLREEISSQKSELTQMKQLMSQWPTVPIALPRHPETATMKATDSEIRGIILNLSIVIGIFLYHFLFLLNASTWLD